eukprot:TRINITY_DN12541_c0_g1_i1.p1 TRINITY_DN12541_c0_g1~~TRINITY_DN12541_c0_g1_i1.p1  ORF type:complete len:618 (-),score=161.18 TRINITY_DN12541_c0_g1_i1:87-1691(-)
MDATSSSSDSEVCDDVFRRTRAAAAEVARGMTDDEYLENFKVCELLDQLKARVLSERPDDPVTFLSNYLDHLAIERRFQLQFPSNPSTDLMSFWAPSVVRTNSYSELSQAVAENNADMRSTGDALISSSSSSSASSNFEAHEPNSPIKLLKKILKSRFDESLGDSKVRLSVGLDIGGSLSKIVFFEPAQRDSQAQHYAKEIEFVKHSLTYGTSGKRDPDLCFKWRKGRFHFLNFETRKFHGALELLKLNGLLRNEKILLATGGGAQKYAKLIKRELGCKLAKGDELACLLLGINFLLEHVEDELFYLEDHRNPMTSEKIPYNVSSDETFPYILVNIGSGVSILLVNDERHFKRVSGTSIGGGTFFGLCKLLTHCESFEEAVELASSGSSSNVDMTVSDIYGGDYKAFGLKASTVASSFGKCMLREPEDFGEDDFKSEDIAVSLLNMISVNIAQLAYLSAMRYKVTRIMFAGNFLRRNPKAMGALSFSINYWSHGVMKALFLKHEGYFGALGAFLLQEKALLDLFDDPNKQSRES